MHLHRLLRGRAGPHAHVRGLRRPQGQHQALQDLQYLSVGLLDTKNKTQKQAEDKILLFSEETNYGTNDRFNVKAQVHIPNAIAESKSKKSKKCPMSQVISGRQHEAEHGVVHHVQEEHNQI